MITSLSRRHFLARAVPVLAFPSLLFPNSSRPTRAVEALKFPLVDFHVHLDNSTIDNVLKLSQERGVKFGIVEHAGTKENQYPVVLSNDAELKRYLAMLDSKPVYKGVQAEWIDWRACFSSEVLGQLDFVLSDAMTFPGQDGRRMKLWEKGAEIGDPESFMDRYADWHVEIMSKEPLDILANTTWLPPQLLPDYERLWTSSRRQKVIDAAIKYGVALEISASYKLPKRSFLDHARDAGVKFSLGSNGRYPVMGRLDYAIEMAQALNLNSSDLFTPAPAGQKPFQRRRL